MFAVHRDRERKWTNGSPPAEQHPLDRLARDRIRPAPHRPRPSERLGRAGTFRYLPPFDRTALPVRRLRTRTSLALAAIVLPLALAGVGTLSPRPAIAQDGFCPANLEQGDPCGDGAAGKRATAPDSGSARPPTLPGVTLGNPVSLVTGAKRQREIDFDPGGASGATALAFRRHYDSANADVDIGLGPGWRHSHAGRAQVHPERWARDRRELGASHPLRRGADG